VIPCVEAAVETGAHRIGVLGTRSTVESGAYPREIQRRQPEADVVQVAAPMLVPLIENDALRHLGPFLDEYLAELGSVDALVLGCTHYGLIAEAVRQRFVGPVLSSDEVVPEKLADYLDRHPEHETKLSRSGTRRYCVTDLTPGYAKFATRLMGEPINLERVNL
jgi:glutamate racemase